MEVGSSIAGGVELLSPWLGRGQLPYGRDGAEVFPIGVDSEWSRQRDARGVGGSRGEAPLHLRRLEHRGFRGEKAEDGRR
jgi:hypothetical protein